MHKSVDIYNKQSKKSSLSCVEFAEEREEGALSPCALALLRVNIQTAWRGFTQDTLQLALVGLPIQTR